MLTLLGQHTRLCDGVSRRGFLKIGSLGFAGLALPDLLRANQGKRPDTAVILYWLAGGPSHIDTFDMKPTAPAENRGAFKPIATRVPGLQVCELLPHHARVADRFAVVRSLTHGHSVHDDAAHWVQTGQPQFNARNVGQQFPCQGSVLSHLRGANQPGVPPYVCIPQAYKSRPGFYQKATFLGARHDPLDSGGDPVDRGKQKSDFSMPTDLTLSRVADRRELVRSLDSLARTVEGNPAFQAMDAAYQRAFELVGSRAVKEAFDLDREPAAVRDKYGRSMWGKNALLARRLVEAGVGFVTVNHYEADVDWWDDHSVIEKNLRKRLPVFDQAVATLIDDIHDRGLAERVLVVAVGEFGRGPRVDSSAGRGHWPYAFHAVLSGGGVKGGRIVGATTADGGQVRDRPVRPGDLLATIYKSLGIDHEQMIRDKQDRPIRLAEGEPVTELF